MTTTVWDEEIALKKKPWDEDDEDEEDWDDDEDWDDEDDWDDDE